MKQVDDTRSYKVRIGSAWHDSQAQIHIEAFNHNQPELREYFQIVEYADGSCRYTATHESCYMQLEMGQELYQIYFGQKQKPEFFIDSSANDFTGPQIRYRFIFNMLKLIMHEHIIQNGDFVSVDPEKASEEKIECLIKEIPNQSPIQNALAKSATYLTDV